MFFLQVISIFDGEGMLTPEVLEIEAEQIQGVFTEICQRVASVCLAIGAYPRPSNLNCVL